MIRSSGINTHRSLLWIFLAGMILGSSAILPAAADLQNTGNETRTAEYENGTVTAEWAVDFTASPLEGYPPVCAKFILDGPFGDYLWDFGTGPPLVPEIRFTVTRRLVCTG